MPTLEHMPDYVPPPDPVEAVQTLVPGAPGVGPVARYRIYPWRSRPRCEVFLDGAWRSAEIAIRYDLEDGRTIYSLHVRLPYISTRARGGRLAVDTFSRRVQWHPRSFRPALPPQPWVPAAGWAAWHGQWRTAGREIPTVGRPAVVRHKRDIGLLKWST